MHISCVRYIIHTMYGSWIYVEIKFCGLGRTRQSIPGIWHIKYDMKDTDKVTKMSQWKVNTLGRSSTQNVQACTDRQHSYFARVTRDQFVCHGGTGVRGRARPMWMCGVWSATRPRLSPASNDWKLIGQSHMRVITVWHFSHPRPFVKPVHLAYCESHAN